MFTVFDLFAVGTILVSMLISTSHGMVAELFDFFGWIISLILARALSSPIADNIMPNMQPRQMAIVCAFVLVFVATRLFQRLLRFALDSAINKAKLTHLNRLLGGILGIMKGVLFVGLAVFFCSFSSLPYSDDWQSAATSRFFEGVVKSATPLLPEAFADQVHFPARDAYNDYEDIEPIKKERRRYQKPPVERLTP